MAASVVSAMARAFYIFARIFVFLQDHNSEHVYLSEPLIIAPKQVGIITNPFLFCLVCMMDYNINVTSSFDYT
jgi:uncharacterized membrane protein